MHKGFVYTTCRNSLTPCLKPPMPTAIEAPLAPNLGETKTPIIGRVVSFPYSGVFRGGPLRLGPPLSTDHNFL